VLTLAVIKEVGMDCNRAPGNWKQVKGKVKWGKPTGDDRNVAKAYHTQLASKLQERCAYARDHVRKGADDRYAAQQW
jgi:uncharacterized protein YjbJ (UPF0337 family)